MNNINKMFDGLGGIVSLPGLDAGIGGAVGFNPLGGALGLGANDPLAAGAGVVGTGMMSGGSSSGGNPAQASGQTPDYSYVDNLPSTVPDAPIPNVSVPGSVQAADQEEEFDYGRMLESLSVGTEKLSESSEPTAAPSMGTTRGAAPSGPIDNPYASLGGQSPAMSAIQNSRPMIGAQPSIEQILQSLAR